MSDSTKSSVAENVTNLDLKETEATEYSNTGKSTESTTSINLIITESDNSNIAVAVDTVTDCAKNQEQSVVAVKGAEDNHANKKPEISKDLKGGGSTSKLPSKPRFFSGSRIYFTDEANADYLTRLLKEKEELRVLLPNSFHFKHALRLLNEEISQIREKLSQRAERRKNEGKLEEIPEMPAPGTEQGTTTEKPTSGKKVFLQEKIFIPVKEYPNHNFVGRILGPRGMTAKQLEEESGCRIMIRGRGSTREGNTRRLNVQNSHLKEELHVLVQCEDFEEIAKEKIRRATECIRYMLIPPPEGEDELKRRQLMELSIINGTYRPTTGSRIPLRNRSVLTPANFDQFGAGNVFSTVNNLPIFGSNGGIEDGRHTPFYDGRNLPYGYGEQYPYNECTIITRQALASLGFDMDAFEIADYCGKRMNRGTSAGVNGRQGNAIPATVTAAPYPRHYGFGSPIVDPFNVQYMWNPSINPPIFGFYDNSPNALARGYYNDVIAGLAPTINSGGPSFGDGMAQPNASRVNLQQYIAAATLLNGVPNFHTDGSGDGPSGHR